MSLTVGVNSWATVAEADSYLTDRIGTTTWFSLDESPASPVDDSKETMLITAFQVIRSFSTFSINPSNEDPEVKDAQIEMALFLLGNYDEWEKRLTMNALGIEDFDFSEHSEKLNLDRFGLPPIVAMKLSNYYTGTGVAQLYGEDYLNE